MRRVDAGDVVLAVEEAGEGEPVVLLHGFPELSHSWRAQLPALAAAGFHAVAPDLRGYGRSDRPPDVTDYTFPKLVGDLVGLIRGLGYESAHVVGHDWGGSIAWATAALVPDVVRSLTILNCPHPVASAEARQIPEQQRKSWYMLLFQFPGVAEEWLAKDDFENVRRMVFGTAAPEAFPEEDRRVFLEALSQPGALTAALNYYRANIPPENWLKPPPEMPPVTVPTMLVWALDDAYMSPLLLDLSAAKVAGPLRIERLPGVSHWVQQEVPDTVNRLLLDFLSG